MPEVYKIDMLYTRESCFLFPLFCRWLYVGPGRVTQPLSKEVTVCPYQVWYNCLTHLPKGAETTLPHIYRIAFHFLHVYFFSFYVCALGCLCPEYSEHAWRKHTVFEQSDTELFVCGTDLN